MNSLAYLSRQFDVLASPRTPPSTPTLENAPLLADPDAAAANLKRVQTWSTKSFAGAVLPSGATSYSPWTLKRSYSSPAEVQHGESSLPLPPSPPQPVASTSSQPMRSSPPTPTRSTSRRPSVSSTEKAIRPKLRSESLFHRVFFVHVLFGLWHCLCGAWRSIRARFVPLTEHEVAAEDASDDDEKDTEDESKGEKHSGIRAEQPPPIPPPILPAALTTHYPSVIRTNTDPLLDVKLPVSDATPASPIALARSAEQSRTPTPALGARKMALHLPKTLVLDLDETLIHSTSRPMHSPTAGLLGSFGLGRRNRDSGHTVEVTLGGRSTLYHVYKRPFADYFLRKVRGAPPPSLSFGPRCCPGLTAKQVSAWYTLVIFTASMQEYADPVIDWLDAGRGILGRRLFREVRRRAPQLLHPPYPGPYSVVHSTAKWLIYQGPIYY